MKRYKLTFGDSIRYRHPHPERTARKTAGDGWDIIYQVWNSRKAMALSIRMQEKRGIFNTNGWRALVSLRDGEGY